MKQKDRYRNWLGIRGIAASALTGVGISAVSVGMAPSIVQAQVPFQIIRPDNGATVRETVKIVMSRRALDDAEIKYLSFSIDGKFRQAVAVLPLTNGEKHIHSDLLEVDPTKVALLWNTKLPSADTSTTDSSASNSLGVEDGTHTVELVAQSGDGRRLGTKTLTLNVQNRGGLQVPADGLQMDYHFQVGDNSKYRETTVVEFDGDHLNQTQVSQSTGGEGYVSRGRGGGGGGGSSFPGGPGGDGMAMGMGGPGGPGGGRGFGGPGGGYSPITGASGEFTVLVQNVLADYERSTEDNLGDGLFFIRDKVTDGTIIGGNGSAARLEDVYTFKSRYRSIFTSGRVKEFGLANAAHPGAYVAMPIPNIGGGRRRVGQTWKTLTPIKLEWATLDKPPVVQAVNVLEGLEWQDGYQTARIRQTYNGKADIPIYGGAGTMQGATVKMERTIWFAYKAGKIIRSQTDMTVSGDAPAPVLSSMVPSAGVNSSIGGGGIGGDTGGPAGMKGFSGAGGPPVAGGPGNMGGGFGSLQGTEPQEVVRVPAKFHSTSTVQLVLPGTL